MYKIIANIEYEYTFVSNSILIRKSVLYCTKLSALKIFNLSNYKIGIHLFILTNWK